MLRSVRVDYHLHLAPDGETLRDEHLSIEQLRRYVRTASDHGIGEIGLTEHVHRFRQAAALSAHPFWQESAESDLDEYHGLLAEARDDERLPLLVSLELDYLPGRESETATLVTPYEWDYLLGAVHWLGDLAVDHPDWSVWAEASVDAVWETYVETLVAAAASGLFDVMAHPDLAKVFGDRPTAHLLPGLYERATEAFATAGVVAELSTAGLRKGAEEIYPAPAFLAALERAGVPISLASDAHTDEHIGWEFDRALRLAYDAGYRTVTQFRRRDQRQVSFV
ncbi:MAG: Histidinol-phosphatase [uncultured Thermoleophilia bacterium]|uniref:Histidinol-phosphatase n=1 Tax=uncultured Thermoleophilia bacterium TaxID=1497501 RepID=A0A6J4TSD8_9ACTN|nr:MAG: Histidinol-phosphatase [uncultured Thermoleophilia bacterium]